MKVVSTADARVVVLRVGDPPVEVRVLDEEGRETRYRVEAPGPDGDLEVREAEHGRG